MPPINLTPPRPHDYIKRIMAQTLSWAMGRPYHEKVCDECCPDFSCCYPDLFTPDDQERWRTYRETKERLEAIPCPYTPKEGKDDE